VVKREHSGSPSASSEKDYTDEGDYIAMTKLDPKGKEPQEVNTFFAAHIWEILSVF
jgi:hypothetical protein